MMLSTVELMAAAVFAYYGNPATAGCFAIAWLYHRRWEKRR